jgi:organic hydroperoxide reductase OsmC/OhrA
MSEHRATVRWTRTSADFTYETYNRAHELEFDEGLRVPASSAPEFRGDKERLDPESAFVSALSSCHMLTFLALAARRRHTLEFYQDNAVGFLEKNSAGKRAMTRVILRPKIVWSEDTTVSNDEVEMMHRLAHAECFIANSVTTEVSVEMQD